MPNVYPISGNVTMSNFNGNTTVTFASNFQTIQGITLEVFLGKTNALNTATDVLISTIPLGPGVPFQGPITGAHSYVVPNGVDINDFDYVLVQCTSANILWGFANLSDVVTTRIGSFTPDRPSVYPLTGNVFMTNDNGVYTVNFGNNFATIQGLVLEVFLAKTSVLDTLRDVVISTLPLGPNIDFMDPITGAHSFPVPHGIGFYEFPYVIIQCTVANLPWGYANLCDMDLTLNQQPLASETYLAEEISSSTELSPNSDYRIEGYHGVNLNTGFEVPLTTEFLGLAGQPHGCLDN